MHKIMVSDASSLVAALAALHLKLLKKEELSFDESFNLCVKMYGEQWDGKLDYKVAEYIIRLQRAVIFIYNEISDKKIKYNSNAMDSVRVTVEVKNGCEELIAGLKDVAMSLPPEYQICAIIAIFAIYTIGKRLVEWRKNENDRKTEQEKIESNEKIETAKIESAERIEKQKNENEQVKDEILMEALNKLHDISDSVSDNGKEISKSILSTLDRALEISNDNQPHLHYLATKMKNDDLMQINNEQKMSQEEVLEKYPTPVQSDIEPFEYLVDGEYEVVNIDRVSDKVKIVIGGKRRVFSLERLSDDGRHDLYKDCVQQKVDKKHVPATKLQLTACFRGGVFAGGFVDGFGEKREKTLSFDEAKQLSINLAEQENESND